jgi:protein-tyrosine-phosphatase
MATLDAIKFLGLLGHEHRWRLVRSLAQGDLRAGELVEILEQPANLVSYHLRQLRDQNLVHERRSSADRRDVYYSLDLTTLRQLFSQAGESVHPALLDPDSAIDSALIEKLRAGVRVLFLCTHNSARSQMAEGLLRSMSHGRIASFSAGTEPSRVQRLAIRAMAADGIDIQEQRSKHLDDYLGEHFDYVITVCDRASEACPVFPGTPERIHWSIPDPSAVTGADERRYKAFRDAMVDLRTRIRYFLISVARAPQKPS